MDAADLRAGFWLMCQVEHHGEAVDRLTLRAGGWPGRSRSDQLLRAGIRALREPLGASPKDPSHIVTVSRLGLALIAHREPLAAVAAPHATSQPPGGRLARRTPVGRLQTLIVELRRRSVFKVSGGYLLGMWIMLQVAEVTFEPLRLPDWWMTALAILAVIGLPIVATLAWSYEITPGGSSDLGDGLSEELSMRLAQVPGLRVTMQLIDAAKDEIARAVTEALQIVLVPKETSPAIRLGLRELESRPSDALLVAQLGYYYGRVGDAAASMSYLDRAAAKGTDLYVQYYPAVAAADRGDLERAREGALAAVRLGYPKTLLQADPSLAGLRLQKKKSGG